MSPNTSGLKRGGSPGRPEGSRDFRPFVMETLRRMRCAEVVAETFNKYKKDLSPKEQLWFLLELMKLGVQASPRQVDLDQKSSVCLVIHGLKPNPGTVDVDGVVLEAGTTPVVSAGHVPASLPEPSIPSITEAELSRRKAEADAERHKREMRYVPASNVAKPGPEREAVPDPPPPNEFLEAVARQMRQDEEALRAENIARYERGEAALDRLPTAADYAKHFGVHGF